MADPATLALISIGGSAGGGILGAAGKIFGGMAGASSYKYQAGVAQINQQIAQRNAEYARTVGEVEAQRSGMKTKFGIGQTKVIQSGRGIDVGSGSPAAVREGQADIGRHEQDTIRSNAARKAYGYEWEAEKQKVTGAMYKQAATNTQIASYIGAAESVLGGSSSVSSKWLQASEMGYV